MQTLEKILEFIQPYLDWFAEVTLTQKILLTTAIVLAIAFIFYIAKELAKGILSIVLYPIRLPFILIDNRIKYKQKLKMDRAEQRRQKRIEYKQNIKKIKEENKRKYSNKNVSIHNQLLARMTKPKKISIWGEVGAGKSQLTMVVAWYLLMKTFAEDEKNKKMNMALGFGRGYKRLQQLKKLFEAGFMPIYSNIDVEWNGYKSQEVLPIITQIKKAIEQAILIVDDSARLMPKSMHQEKANEYMEKIEDYGASHRHYDDSWIISNQQSKDGVWIGFRRTGSLSIEVRDNWRQITPIGKAILARKNFMQNFFPSFLTGKPILSIRRQLFLSGKVRQFLFNMVLPLKYSQEKRYYLNKLDIWEKVKQKYQMFYLLFVFEGKEHVIEFDQSRTLHYPTRAYADEHDQKYDEEGDLIYGKKNNISINEIRGLARQ